jgi:sulfoquinovosidase
MLQFIESNKSISVVYKDFKLMELGRKNSLKVGIGHDEYTMKRGAFKFKEKVRTRWYHLDCLDRSRNRVTLRNGTELIHLSFNTDMNRLILSFDYTNKELNRLYLVLNSEAEEMPFGCGEQFAAFNLKHKKVKIWVSEHVSLSSLVKKVIASYLHVKVPRMSFQKYASYMVQPTFMTNKKRFVHLDSQSFSMFRFDTKKTCIEVREPLKNLYFGEYETYKQLMDSLTEILGKQPQLPEWVFDGMILGIQDGTKVCTEKVNKMKEFGADICGIWAQDWEGQRITKFGKQLFWNWEYDTNLYENLPEAIVNWQENGIKFLGYINPFLAIEGSLYEVASKKGYVVKNQLGQDYMVTITTFPAAMIDLTNPDAVRFLKDVIITKMLHIGLRGWMADFAEYLPTDCKLFSGEDPRLIHNQWPVLWAKLNKEAIEEGKERYKIHDEILFFVRAGYTHTSKYAKLVWNGDQHVDWSRDYGLGSIVNSALSLAVSGMGNSHSDIGGYTTFGKMVRSKELLLRWTELSTFSMVMRSHEGNQPDKNHQFDSDEETARFIARFTRIFKQLKPYRLHVDAENAATGMPSMRPLFFHYEDEKFLNVDQGYMLGEDLIVYPVVTSNTQIKEVLMPTDGWVHLFDESLQINNTIPPKKACEKVKVACPLGKPIVYYRKESVFADLFKSICKIAIDARTKRLRLVLRSKLFAEGKFP